MIQNLLLFLPHFPPSPFLSQYSSPENHPLSLYSIWEEAEFYGLNSSFTGHVTKRWVGKAYCKEQGGRPPPQWQKVAPLKTIQYFWKKSLTEATFIRSQLSFGPHLCPLWFQIATMADRMWGGVPFTIPRFTVDSNWNPGTAFEI